MDFKNVFRSRVSATIKLAEPATSIGRRVIETQGWSTALGGGSADRAQDHKIRPEFCGVNRSKVPTSGKHGVPFSFCPLTV